MKDLLKKAMLTGIGLAAVSKDKIEELIGEIVQKGNMTEQEGKNFVEEMVGYGEKARGEMEKQVDKYVEKAINRMDLVRRSDLEDMRTSIMEIQRRLENIDKPKL